MLRRIREVNEKGRRLRVGRVVPYFSSPFPLYSLPPPSLSPDRRTLPASQMSFREVQRVSEGGCTVLGLVRRLVTCGLREG